MNADDERVEEAPAQGGAPVEPAASNPAPRPWHRPMPAWAQHPLVSSIGTVLRDPTVLFQLLLVFSLVMRVVYLDVPANRTIFDETYYVNAARVILGITPPEGGKYPDRPLGVDPNREHPPLGKLLIAGSMTVLGDNPVGWRAPSVIAGMLVLIALWLTIQAAGGSKWLALLAVFLVSLDNLSMVHGRMAVLDILALAPAMLASWLALRRRWLLAAVLLAVGMLVKLTAVYALGAIVLMWLLQVAPQWWAARRVIVIELLQPVLFVALSITLFLGGLGLLDARWSEYKNPIDHVSHMVQFGSIVGQRQTSLTGICPKTASRPLQWLGNDCQIQYYRSDVTERSGDVVIRRSSRIDIRGAMNEVLVGALPLAMLFTAWFAWRRRHGPALWALSWAAANWGSYLLLSVVSIRAMYIYYFLPVVPAVATAIAILLLYAKLPRFVVWGFLALYVIGFIAYFPYRQFLG